MRKVLHVCDGGRGHRHRREPRNDVLVTFDGNHDAKYPSVLGGAFETALAAAL